MDKKNEKIQSEDKEQNLDDIAEEVNQESEELAQLRKQVSESQEKFKRAIADYQNLQRRTYEQKAEWIKSANKDLLLKLLPVLDTLMLAGKHIEDKGLVISVDQFLKVLDQEGIKRIKTEGEDFDPQTMEAIATQEGESGKVLEEVRAGFLLYEIVLRSAQVIVGKRAE